jgi:Holliday junction DNA helicase RuvA
VREDSLTLYGFADDDERALFELLQTAVRRRPRLAQAVLTVHTPDASAAALSARTSRRCAWCPASAARARSGWCSSSRTRQACPAPRRRRRPQAPGWRDTLSQALVGLGWTARSPTRSSTASRPATPTASDEDVPVLLRARLAQLGPEPGERGRARRARARRARGARRAGARAARRRRPGAGRRGRAAPRRLDEFVGQQRVREQVGLVLESARRRGRPPDHVLLSGAPGSARRRSP